MYFQIEILNPLPYFQSKGFIFYSFTNVPKITQKNFSLEVKLSWTDRILHLAKCVDYFYVEHAQVANGYEFM